MSTDALTVEFVVKHGKETIRLQLGGSATVRDLKEALAVPSRIPPAGQKLLFNAPAVKTEHRRDAPDTLTLAELVSAAGAAAAAAAGTHTVRAMLIGSSSAGSGGGAGGGSGGGGGGAEVVDASVTSEAARLVACTLEDGRYWYRCSYNKGYLRQTAYLCRTCINTGRADARHCLCLACAEYCHGGHEVEEWGVRYYMRCDCCTSTCWREPTSAIAAAAASATEAGATNDAEKAGNTQRGGDEKLARNSGLRALALADASADSVAAVAKPVNRKRSRSSSPLTPRRTPRARPVDGGVSPNVSAVDEGGNNPNNSSSNTNNTINNNNDSTNSIADTATSAVPEAPPPPQPSPFALRNPPEFETRAVSSPHAAAAGAPPTTAPHGRVLDPKDIAARLLASASGGSGSSPVAVTAPSAAAAATATGGNASGTSAGGPAGTALDLPPVPREELYKCAFVVDSKTNRPPVYVRIPPNRENRYPRRADTWCHCRDDASAPQPPPPAAPSGADGASAAPEVESGGIVCMLCCSCFWSDHLTRLHTAQLRRMPCYGDVLEGDTLAHYCVSCAVYVCTTCRYRCHKDHDVSPDIVVPSADDPIDNGIPTDAIFSCGCREHCAIPDRVPPGDVDDTTTYAPLPPAVATEVMNSDVFMGFVCADCMQEHPWLHQDDLTRCYGGALPPKVTEGLLPVVACGTAPDAEVDASAVYPHHGMLLPVTSFEKGSTCDCAPCRAAFEAFAPRAAEEPPEMVVSIMDECAHCGRSIRYQSAFMCRTCEMQLEASYILCHDCNALRLRLIEEQGLQQQQPQQQQYGQAQQTGGGAAVTGSGTATTAGAPNADAAAAAAAEKPYTHDLSHQFMEDTLDNLYSLCGMQLMRSMDDESRADFLNGGGGGGGGVGPGEDGDGDSEDDEHITGGGGGGGRQEEDGGGGSGNVLASLGLSDAALSSQMAASFGPVPLQFTDEQLREIAEDSKRRRDNARKQSK